MTPKNIRLFFETLQHRNPDPTTELKYSTPFELLIAVILSAQATDRGVNLATEKLFKIANTPQKILKLGVEKFENLVKTINFYPTKTRHIFKTCEILIQTYHSKIPTTRDPLESLPGVGRKTANVILNTLFDHPTIAVDTHVFRVANRTGLAPGKTPLQVEQILGKKIPKNFLKHAHHWLVLHGQYICTARNPKCTICPVSQYCQYYLNTV